MLEDGWPVEEEVADDFDEDAFDFGNSEEDVDNSALED